MTRKTFSVSAFVPVARLIGLPFFFVVFLAGVPSWAAFHAQLPSLTRIPASEEEIFQDWLLQDLAFDPAQGQQAVTPESPARTIFTPAAPDSQNAAAERALVQKVLDEIQKRTVGQESQPTASEPPTTGSDAPTAGSESPTASLESLKSELASLAGVPGTDPRWKELYRKAAVLRRTLRLATARAQVPKLVFTKHPNLGGSHYAYTEALSDAQAERTFLPGSQLCLLELNAQGQYSETVLINDPVGMIRDPELAFDGKSLIFAWKKSDRLDDFHLYRMDLESKAVTQLTFGLGWADYEPCCLPGGDIIFNSTRCSQIVDCFWTEVSNLYRMDSEGRFMRRMTFDQVHDNYPALTFDGRITYTRWDYNDRGQIFPQGLFQMNPDGTGQTALYGNNSWFPTTILHARPIPDTNGKLLCIFTGHHTRQRGKLGVLDPNQGREEADGATLAAPIRETLPVHVDQYGQDGEQFCYPTPVTQTEFFTAYRPNENGSQQTFSPFSIYFMDLEGHRELLVRDPAHSCNQMALLSPKPASAERPSMVDPTSDSGTYYLQDVFYGPGLEGVDRNRIRSLRVVEIAYRSVGIGANGNSGPAGGAMSSTPISIGGGAWDPKKVLGEAKIYPDGSACFRVPAKTPLYFQVIDVDGHVVQTMRSWSTLQPGETFSCVGCHEDKNSIAARGSSSQAMKAGPQELDPFYGPARWFSYKKEVQPILDRHCVRCHDNSSAEPPFRSQELARTRIVPAMLKPLIRKGSSWSVTTSLPKELAASWVAQFPLKETSGADAPQRKAPFGNCPKNPGPATPWETPEIWLTTELILPENYQPKALYSELFHDEDVEIFINGVPVFEAKNFLTRYQIFRMRQNPLKPGRNVVAVHCVQTCGSQGIDLSLCELNETPRELAADVPQDHPFSLLGRGWEDSAAKRIWSESYLNLTNSPFVPRTGGKKSDVVRWIDIQNSPVMLKPYDSGSAKSGLCFMFEAPEPHNGVQLTQEEKDRISCWIDLLVPFCESYEDAAAWEKPDQERQATYQAKKQRAEAFDRASYAAWGQCQLGKNSSPAGIPDRENPYRDLTSEATREETENAVTFTFPTAIRTDQLEIARSPNVSSPKDFKFQVGPFEETVSLTPERSAGRLTFPQVSCQKIRIEGKVSELKTVRILGIQEK